MEKVRMLVEMLGEGIAQNWWQKGYWARFADVILQRSQQKGMAPGAGPRVSPSVPCEVTRYTEDGKLVEQTTVADLLAEIADSQLDLLDSLEDLTDALRQGKKSKRKRRRPKR
jgi:hypothetical protein